MCRSLFSGKLLGQRPMRIVALEDGVAIAVETQRNTVGGDHVVQSAQITKGIFRLKLKLRGQDLTGGVALNAPERELRAAAFEPVMTAGIGEHHHAEARAWNSAAAIPA